MIVRIRLWLIGLIRRQPLRVGLTTAGVAITVALLVALAGFIVSSEATMTSHAIADVPVDWQVQVASGQNPDAVATELATKPGATHIEQVGFASSPGFQATTGTTVQTTGAGQVLGISDTYRGAYPDEIRSLVGDGKVLLAQQTASNLHAVPGTQVTINRPGLTPITVTVDAIVDLPYADSLFQTVGAPSGSAPTAPPDNVLILPLDQWHAAFDPVQATAPSAVHIQLHATIPHDLPSSPSQAFTQVIGEAHNLESRLSGQVTVGNNLGARLDGARSDALYARVLFLFLGLPGALLAMVLTAIFVASSATQRRREQALLRLRGASSRQVVAAAAVEAIAIGVLGSLLGLVAGVVLVERLGGASHAVLTSSRTIAWYGVATLIGLLTTVAMMLIPTWWESRTVSVQRARLVLQRERAPFWERYGLDLILLALAAGLFWQAKQSGYQVVLVPEGLPTVSVHYTSFFAPFLLWIGAALFAVRLVRLLLVRNGSLVAPIVRPIAGALSPLIGAALNRQRSRVGLGLVLVVLALAFAWSTSIFNATYEAQARVDAELSNGSDVTVSATGATDLSSWTSQIAPMPGVTSVEPMMHRFAYVGTDLQDIFGVNPASFPGSVRLADSYFVGSSATASMQALATHPDGILVSPETISDYQLSIGDSLRIRLLGAKDHAYHVVQFTVAGVVREFPTAPTDSFLVANADYIAAQTGSAAVETLLIRTNANSSPVTVGNQVRALLGPASGASVRDIEDQKHAISTGLTSISLRGLSRIELGFAIVLAAAGAALVLFLGFEDRRRSLAITSALGATSRQLGAFTWSEVGIVLVGGAAAGALLGWLLASMLIRLLTGVFDPPPDAASLPWLYLAGVLVVVAGAIGIVGQIVNRAGRREILPTIRRLT
ncbi:MAG: ABC transporter permease [Thermomicrobiales bacterium]